MKLFNAFKETAERFSERPALCESQRQWSYREALEAVTERTLAWDSGAKGSAVMLNLPNSASLVLWELAANASGVVFAPLNTRLPPSRSAVMVGMVEPEWQVTEVGGSPCGGLHWTLVGEVTQSWLWRSDVSRRYSDDVSHIYFSSGSTGQPKAILLSDAPVVSVVRQQSQALGLSPSSRFGWLLQGSFDASLSDCYQTLLSGAALYVSGFELANRLRSVSDFLKKNEITHTDIPPSILHLLHPEDYPALEGIIFGGEVARRASVHRWTAAGKRMFNAYGPTEATICTGLKEVDDAWIPSNIGKAIAGVIYAIEDSGKLALAAPGMRGELVILGEHLALGYSQPRLTAQRFRQSPLGTGYWSGDAVEVDADGDFHFAGRIDRQFKMNGVLVCPEEIEGQAMACGCHEARIVFEAGRIALHFSGPLDESSVRQRVQQSLPQAFWPHRYLKWDSLPKQANGKVRFEPETPSN